MTKYIIRRILLMIPVLLGVLIIVYALSNFMPGDPVLQKLGSNDFTAEEYAAAEAELGLDKPFVIRLVNYIVGVVTEFDLGKSYTYNTEVSGMILSRIWNSVQLGLLTLALSAVMAIPIGIFSAVKQNSAADYIITTLAIILASLPGFWLALESILIFAGKLHWLPATGLSSFKHYILPVTTSAMMTLAGTIRMTRSSMLEVIRQDYICTARAKGMKERRVIFHHALKNALIPVITILGGQFGTVVGGSMIVETIFNIPGMGALMMSAINTRDYPVIMGVTLITSVFVCICNLLVDIVYSFVDPRIKSQFAVAKINPEKKDDKEVKPV